jgi:hypothetical protein
VTVAGGGARRYLVCMATRRALFAAALVTAAPMAFGAARPARAFRLEPADGETEALLAARAEACTADGLHARLQAERATALETAAREGRSPEEVLTAAFSRCPLCGCGLAPLSHDAGDQPGF